MRALSAITILILALTACAGNSSKSDPKFGKGFGAGLNAGRVAGR
ncbi:MAG: hypothetical protein AAF415_13170 [Pseudomonadota bacterium]